MSDPPLARYHFFPWVRRGLAAALKNADADPLPARVALDVKLTVAATQSGGVKNNDVDQSVQLIGPGDVAGIDLRYFVRTEPPQLTKNYEPNYLAGIEFDSPDLPWLFTPAAPKDNRLRPWLALIVMKRGEFDEPKIAPNPLPLIAVNHIAALQDLSESWNWAHVQVSGDSSVDATLANSPHCVVSRLLCPRRLDPETAYVAFLVPAFDVGVKAGLGQDVSGVANTSLAWTVNTATPLTLPYYYRFEFHTSDQGDFESLVRRLNPTVFGDDIGSRPMDVSRPMPPDFPSAGPALGLQGALTNVGAQPTPWNDPDKSTFQNKLQPFLNLSTAVNDDPANPNPSTPRVVPPIYGRWHALVQSVNAGAPGWVNDLNCDPRPRAVGGMGTQVVQANHKQLLASAWAQYAGIIRANELLKAAQLSRAVLEQLHRLRLSAASAQTLLTVTSALFSRMRASSKTVLSSIRSHRVPERFFGGAFRRISTRATHQIRGYTVGSTPALLEKLNAGMIKIVPTPKPPAGMVSIQQVSSETVPAWLTFILKNVAWIVLVLLLLLLVVASVAGIAVAAALVVIAGAAAALFWQRIKPLLQRAAAGQVANPQNMTLGGVTGRSPQPGFTVSKPGVPPSPTSAGGIDSAQARAFRFAVARYTVGAQNIPPQPPILPALELGTLQATVLARIDPAVTVPARMRSIVTLGSWIVWQPDDPIVPIMAAPEFPQAMYAPLRDLSQKYLLPGVDAIPPDSMGLLETNEAFVEAYMVASNYEMSRQLLWNAFPTDQRGSYFRQFWDVSSYVAKPTDPQDPQALREALKDITPIHIWQRRTPLGAHSNRPLAPGGNLVLLIRGELLRRYPNAVVYAGKAKVDATDPRKLVLDETDERYPMFRGTLTPDITFLGFNLSADDAKGGTTQSPHGFFLVFQQQPTEPRFGLEPKAQNGTVTRWADLAWTNFSQIDGALAAGNGVASEAILPLHPGPDTWRYASSCFFNVLQQTKLPDFIPSTVQPSNIAIAGDKDNPDDTLWKWGADSAQTAYITLRLPFRILVSASRMLP